MKNKLIDLNNHLFAQMERLGDEDLKPEQIQFEAIRTNSLVKISDQIIHNAALSLKAAVVASEIGEAAFKVPMIEGGKQGEKNLQIEGKATETDKGMYHGK